MINEKNTKYIIVMDGSSYLDMYKLMFCDILNQDFVSGIVESQKISALEKLLLKDKVRKFTNGILDGIVNNQTILASTIRNAYKEYDNVCVIFLNAALYYRPYLAGYLKSLKRRWTNLKMVLLYLDIVDTGVSKNANYLRENGIFDKIYTIDAKDASCLKIDLIWTPFSQEPDLNKTVKLYDLYFCGASKNRNQILSEVLKSAVSKNIECRMDIVSYEENELLLGFAPMVKIRKPGNNMLYSEVLKNTLAAECILDIVQKNQDALTIRPFEAVCYNRKLLTNNKTILSFPYYDNRYMQYFEKIEDIDWDWLKSDETVDYDYRGEFSPMHLLKQIQESIFNVS